MIQIFKNNSRDGLIGERELRRVLHEHLSGIGEFHQQTIIDALKDQIEPNERSFFRRFRIQEVLKVLDDVKKSKMAW